MELGFSRSLMEIVQMYPFEKTVNGRESIRTIMGLNDKGKAFPLISFSYQVVPDSLTMDQVAEVMIRVSDSRPDIVIAKKTFD